MAYVVITREGEGAAAYAAALAPLGLAAIAMPVTRTEPPPDPDALVRALAAGGYRAIVCASARAAAALVASAGTAPIPEVWAVGPATGRVLAAAQVTAIEPAEVRDGAMLARALLAARDLAGARVLVPRAAEGRDEAIAILRGAGVIVDEVVAYRTVPAPADDPALARGRAVLVAGDAAVCAVFAPSQVLALDALIGVRAISTRWVAIGKTTAVALREAGADDIAVAATPTPEGIANAVAAVYPPRR